MTEHNKKANNPNPYPHHFRISHLLLSLLMPIMIVTGLGIFAVARPEWTWFKGYPGWLPAGRIGYWHMLSAIIFTPVMITAFIDIIKRRGISKITNARWMANYLLLTGGILCLLSAYPLIYTEVSDFVYHLSRLTHSITGLVIIPVALLIHAFSGLSKHKKLLAYTYNVWRQPAWTTLVVLLVITGISWLVTLQIPMHNTSLRTLQAKRTSALTEDSTMLPWDQAEPLTIHLANGSGFDRGRTKVTLRAMHDDNELFMLAEWEDPREDISYWPWNKTETGWKRLTTNLDDETVFYEDKFSLIFPIGKNTHFDNFGCSISCHQSTRMPYGLKITKKPLDVWHWKAARTDPVGYIDDKYWLGTDLDADHAGRLSDSKESGGFTKNLSADKKTPLYLPTGNNHHITGAILENEAIPFTQENQESFPVGSTIPGIVISPVEGDRGDVHCTSSHEDGRWSLYIRRKLDTESDRDVIFEPGGSYSFGCAAFDCAAKRHAYNHSVYTLKIEK